MIVRNEEELLPRCLESVRGIVDEMVVCDTGSQDGTAAIAREAGARLVEFAWCDDFSAARNYALAQTRGDWILHLDADEVLLPGARPAIEEALAGTHAGHLLPLENLLDEEGRLVRQTTHLLRLFRNLSAVRYRGRVHEQVSLEEHGLTIGHCAARIRHDGYLNARVAARDKHGRNLRLLEAALAEAPDDLYALYQRGKTLFAMDRTVEAGPSIEEVIGRLEKTVHPERLAYAPRPFLQRAQIAETGGLAHAIPWIERGLALLPGSAELWLRFGLYCHRAGRDSEAQAAWIRSEELAPHADAAAQAAQAGGDLLVQQGRFLEAAAAYGRVVQHAPREFTTWLRLANALLQAGERTQAIAAYEEVLTREPAEPAAALALGTLYFEQGERRRALVAFETAARTYQSPELLQLIELCRASSGP